MTLSTTALADERVVAAALAELDADGIAIVPEVLSGDEAAHALDRLWAASRESERRGIPTHIVEPRPERAATSGCST